MPRLWAAVFLAPRQILEPTTHTGYSTARRLIDSMARTTHRGGQFPCRNDVTAMSKVCQDFTDASGAEYTETLPWSRRYYILISCDNPRRLGTKSNIGNTVGCSVLPLCASRKL
ncbi:hypothetical protein C8Q70DRAFT_83011 [Cubamyces menziesii]|nr:hypothetical protein C8Q70DRAFT_83011 [Cubamyces menziesii]